MTKEQFEREKNYGDCVSIARSMRKAGLASEREYRKIDTIFKKKYQPVISGL